MSDRDVNRYPHLSPPPEKSKRGISFRSMLFFLILVFLVALGGGFLGMQLAGNTPSSEQASSRIITVEVRITNTPDPNVTPLIQIVTATPLSGQPTAFATSVAGNVTSSAVDSVDLTNNPPPTLNPTLLGDGASPLSLTATALPPGCILHELVEGDTPFGVAAQYEGADPFLLMEVNGLDDETAAFLQIGDVLIVPLEGCAIEALPVPSLLTDSTDIPEETDEPDIEATEEPDNTPTPSPSPTITLAPTASDAQVDIVDVINAGDITAEGIRLRNTGNTVNVTGWTLSDDDGNEFTFPEQLLFSNAEVTINTRAGENTPIALFWGLDTPVWDEGDILTLRDNTGNVQATLRLPAPVGLN